jgi:FAD binding domain-containing protein
MWDLDVDFISVGSGIENLVGAATAAVGGAEVLALEKGPCVGGVTALSAGELWVAGSHLETQAGIRDSWTDGAGFRREGPGRHVGGLHSHPGRASRALRDRRPGVRREGRVTGYDGLYAAGNSMALLDLGGCYQSGAANTRGMTFGSPAARHALGLEAPEDC